MADSAEIVADDVLRQRLRRRYGDAVDPWLAQLPALLASMEERWRLHLDSLIQLGNVSVVIRCRTAEGRPAVLKASPDRTRLHDEAVALTGWDTGCVPAVLAVNDQVGALLVEGIEPGTPLDLSPSYPQAESLARLLACLHGRGASGDERPLTDRITALFESGRRVYERRPDLMVVVPPASYERGRQLAMRLATKGGSTVVLHGDLTPANVLDGGVRRGLVAIDPASCLGDPAFDLVDLLLWRAEEVADVEARAELLRPWTGISSQRAMSWCAAFAPMAALELAEAAHEPLASVDWLLALTRAA